MPSPRKRKLRKYNSNRKSAVRAKAATAAREGNPEPAPVVEELAPVVEELAPVVEELAPKPKKAKKRKPLWSKKTSE
jgi:hypothetical protein